jgi:mono/diheme cytochrome c family protein
MKNSLIVTALLIVSTLILLSFTMKPSQTTPWEVPEKYQKMENPIKSDANSLKDGKKLYNLHCKSCHGKEGLGDGSKAAQLDTPAGDFTAESFATQTDGALFYKSKFGRDEMPNYEKKIPYDEDMWSIINWMRTFE